MVTAKARGLVFEGWWRERVVMVEGGAVTLGVLYLDYKRSVGSPMESEAFLRRVAAMGATVQKRRALGIRLLPLDAETAPPPVAPPKARAVSRRAAVAKEVLPPMHVAVTAMDEDEISSARVMAELFEARCRQRRPKDEGGEGHTNEHDDRYAGQLASAAAAYAYAAAQPADYRAHVILNAKPEKASAFGWHVLDVLRRLWPWDAEWWKPRTPREDLVRAGALVIAAIEKIDRAEARAKAGAAHG